MDSYSQDLVTAGFARCPNNPNRWYAAGPGIMEPVTPLEIRLTDHGLALVVLPYGKFNATDAIDILRFSNVADMLSYLATHGRRSQGGQPAFLHGD